MSYTGKSVSLPNGDAAEAIGFNGNYAYVADWESGGVWKYTVAVNGTLEDPVQVAPVDGYGNSNAGSLSINNGYIYTTCNGGNACPNNNPSSIQIYQIQANGLAQGVESQSYIAFSQSGGKAVNVVFVNGLAYAAGTSNNGLFP